MANDIDSKSKRDRLVPRREPYWAKLKVGLAVGYRKLPTGDGTWIARWRDESNKQKYRSLGNQGSFDEAADQARRWAASCELGVTPSVTTVSGACADYVKNLRAEGRSATAKDAEGRFNRLVFSASIGRQPLDKLKSSTIRAWLTDQIADDEDADDEDIRRSKDSANRNLATLKAALNFAFRNHLVSTDLAWRPVEAFKKVGASRPNAFLSMEQRTALLNACDQDLQLFVKGLLLTGARPGELAGLKANDFDKRLGTLTLRGKTGTRTVPVSTDAAKFFASIVKTRIGDAPMFVTSYGQPWSNDAWKKRVKKAVEAASLPDTVVLYACRHTAISEMILNGMDSVVVAKLTGTSVEMIESHYGHLRHSTVKAKLDNVTMLSNAS